jgi:hypothetical protein
MEGALARMRTDCILEILRYNKPGTKQWKMQRGGKRTKEEDECPLKHAGYKTVGDAKWRLPPA